MSEIGSVALSKPGSWSARRVPDIDGDECVVTICQWCVPCSFGEVEALRFAIGERDSGDNS